MNTLDELFGEALEREALATTQQSRSAVADVTVYGARRRRRVRGTVQGLAVVGALAVVALVGQGLARDHAVTPADPTPTPTPVESVPAIIVPANLDYASVVDERFPDAPAMTASAWDNVTPEWDVEIVSFIGGGRDVMGSVVAIYLTPPGGGRMLAWATNDTSLVDVQMFYFDAATRTVALANGPIINLFDGTVTSLEWAEGTEAVRLPMTPSMGRATNGDSLFFFYTVDTSDVYTAHVYRMSGEMGTGIYTGEVSPSSVWGDTFVVSAEDGVSVVSVDGQVVREFPDLAGCFFQSWNLDGTFNVECDASQTEAGEVRRADPETGATETILVTPTTTAIDARRSWGDVWNTNLPMRPPVVYEDGVQVANLAEGFTEDPKSYGAIFGARAD